MTTSTGSRAGIYARGWRGVDDADRRVATGCGRAVQHVRCMVALVSVAALGDHADRLDGGRDDEVDVAAGLVVDVAHHPQRAAGAGADYQPAALPWGVLGGR